MSTQQSTVDFILDQLSALHNVKVRKMFGEYALYCNEKVVALICDDQLFVKLTDPGKALAKGRYTEGYAYPGAKVSMDITSGVDDQDFLCELIQVTADALPTPKPKKIKK
jgi:TfoX/Sxy family transcriptional regulator of competence genes